MPLHISQHKSYHVYNRENIERVQRDEEEERRKQKAADQQRGVADSEARLAQLRRQRDARHSSATGPHASEQEAVAGPSRLANEGNHVQNDKSTSSGRDGRLRNAAEGEAKMGDYLGALAKDGPAWYGDPNFQGPKDRRRTEEQKLEAAYKDSALKSTHDPLKAMADFLAQKKAAQQRQAEKMRSEGTPSAERDEDRGVDSYRHYVDQKSEASREQDFCERPGDVDPGGTATTNTIAQQQPSHQDAMMTEAITAGEMALDVQAVTEGTTELDSLPNTMPCRAETTATAIKEEPDEGMTINPQTGRDDLGHPTIVVKDEPQEETITGDETPGETPLRGAGRDSHSPTPFGESMYPTLLAEMIGVVLSGEAYLFDDTEEAVLRRYAGMSYEARYLFARLIQRKDTWLRLQALKASYSSEIQDLEGAVEELTDEELPRFLMTHAQANDEGQQAMLALLTLDELKTLAKRMNTAKTGTTTKASIIAALLTTKSQGTLASFFGGLPTSPSSKRRKVQGSTAGGPPPSPKKPRQLSLHFNSQGKKASQSARLANEVTELLGPLVRVSPATRSLIDRVALVFYRGAMLGGTALTTAVLARSRRRNYPRYAVQRSPKVFPTRQHLLAFEEAVAVENEMEEILQWGDGSEATFNKALQLFETIWPVWQATVAAFDADPSLQTEAANRSAYHRMRFHAGWPQTRVVYKGATVLARFKLHAREEEVLRSLLAQRYFRRGKRGEWYDRLALITAMYSYPDNKVKGKTEALRVAVAGVEDRDTHLIYHDQLQRRIMRLENQLPIPKSQKHDFSYAKLRQCRKRTFQGVRLDTMDDGSCYSDGQSLLAPLPSSSSSSSPTKRSSPRTTLASGGGDPSDAAGAKSDISPAGSRFQVRAPLHKIVKVEKRNVSPTKRSYAGRTSGDSDGGGGGGVGARTTPQQGQRGQSLLKRSWSSSSDLLLASNPDGGNNRSTTPTAGSAALGSDSPNSSSGSMNVLLPPGTGGGGSTGGGGGKASPDLSGLDEATLAQYEVTRKEQRKSMHSVWRGIADEGAPCRVEDLVLQHYAAEGYVGYHDEGGMLKMLFALCMWDIIFASGSVCSGHGGESHNGGDNNNGDSNDDDDDSNISTLDVTDVFETPYQRAPLDMDQDSFAITRLPLIQRRLALVSGGAAPRLVAETDDRERPRKTWAVGCRWDTFPKEHLVEVATLLPGSSLAVVFQMMCEEWGHCSGGMPDLIVWRPIAPPQPPPWEADEAMVTSTSTSTSLPNFQGSDQHNDLGDVKPVVSEMQTKDSKSSGLHGVGGTSFVKTEPGDADLSSSSVLLKHAGSTTTTTKTAAVAAATMASGGPAVKLCEVKGPGDRLSETQKVWIDVLLRADIPVEVSLVREGPAQASSSFSTAADAAVRDGRQGSLKREMKSPTRPASVSSLRQNSDIKAEEEEEGEIVKHGHSQSRTRGDGDDEATSRDTKARSNASSSNANVAATGRGRSVRAMSGSYVTVTKRK